MRYYLTQSLVKLARAIADVNDLHQIFLSMLEDTDRVQMRGVNISTGAGLISGVLSSINYA